MFLLTPRYVKQGRAFARDARKVLAYKRDLLSAQTIAEFEAGIATLEHALRARDKAAVEAAAHDLDKQCGEFVGSPESASWRENCEVFLVAIVVALGVRTYFLQPFTIPTGSMQPTLNGIIGAKTDTPPPNILTRIAQFALWGRTWVNVVADTEDMIESVREVKAFPFTNIKLPFGVSRAELVGRRSTYIVDCPIDTLQRQLMEPGRPLKPGDVIARGFYETGDHVFVDKVSYHFRQPKRGEVFVFNTQNIPRMGDLGPPPKKPSQFYIKRLVGVPGDTLRIAEPEFFVNGARATEPGMVRVMSKTNGYAGYANGFHFPRFQYLLTPQDTFPVPANQYFAMGDNSYHSSDSRDWGPVPEGNLMGRGLFVYWPFTSHFGLIR